MSLYAQGLDLRILLDLHRQVPDKRVIDVGAEKGTFVEAFLRAGCPEVHALEPYPPHVGTLTTRFAGNAAVRILPAAAGASDGQAMLHIAQDRSGRDHDYYHSLVHFEGRGDIVWRRAIPIQCRSLGSLVEEGRLPPEVGILKIDTEGNDLAVLQGLGRLRAAVIMAEYWHDLPEVFGPCPYALSDIAEILGRRGYSHFGVITRHDEFESIQLNSTATRPGDWGNVVFVHDDAFPSAFKVLQDVAPVVHATLLDRAIDYRDQCRAHIRIIQDLQRQIEARWFGPVPGGAARSAEPPSMATLAIALAGYSESVAALRSEVSSKDATLPEVRKSLEACATELDTLIRRHGGRIGPVRRLLRSALQSRLLASRLGQLVHYPSRKLDIPPHYYSTGPPTPCPRISIVTATMNAEAVLERAIRSVIDQGYPELEYIVQDGASVDGTRAILERYRDQLAVVRSEPDRGQSDALNRGFASAGGEILAYLNSDDLLLPGALSCVARFFTDHPDVDVVYGHRILIDADDQEIGRWVLPPHDDAVLSWADYVPQETLFWRRRIWDRVGATLDESFQFAMDWDLLLRFRDAGARFARIPRFLGAFRVHADQKTSAQMASIGQKEMARLRERVHGHPVSPGTVRRHVLWYLVRHVLCQKLYRLGILRY